MVDHFDLQNGNVIWFNLTQTETKLRHHYTHYNTLKFFNLTIPSVGEAVELETLIQG